MGLFSAWLHSRMLRGLDSTASEETYALFRASPSLPSFLTFFWIHIRHGVFFGIPLECLPAAGSAVAHIWRQFKTGLRRDPQGNYAMPHLGTLTAWTSRHAFPRAAEPLRSISISQARLTLTWAALVVVPIVTLVIYWTASIMTGCAIYGAMLAAPVTRFGQHEEREAWMAAASAGMFFLALAFVGLTGTLNFLYWPILGSVTVGYSGAWLISRLAYGAEGRVQWKIAVHRDAVAMTLLVICAGFSLSLLTAAIKGSAASLFAGFPFRCAINEQQFVDLAYRSDYLWAIPDRVRASSLPREPRRRMQALIRDKWSGVVNSREIDDEAAGRRTGGLGIGRLDDDGVITYVHSRSPGYAAGLRRGDKIITAVDMPDAVLLHVAHTGSDLRALRVRRADFTLDEVRSAVIPAGADNVGYIWVGSFLADVDQDLDQAFDSFDTAKVQRVVIDLRDNGGGDVEATQHFLDLLVGRVAPFRVALTLVHRGERHMVDRPFFIWPARHSLRGVRRVVFIVGKNTCSAAEMLVASTAQFVATSIVGETTCGKPFIFEPLHFHNDTYLSVTARVRLTRSSTDYSVGIVPQLQCKDDYETNQWDRKNPLIRAALLEVVK
jgi:C-terminal processing protease CtpA/Prc